MTKVAAWLGVRLDRIADRWDRSLDRIAGRWDRFAEAVSAPWYRSLDRIADRWDRSLDRIAGRWDRLAEAASAGWERVMRQGHDRRRRHGESERRAYRGRRVRTARAGGEQSRRRVADWIVAGALTLIVGLASFATLSALRDAGLERSAPNADLDGPGRSFRAVEGPGGIGATPEERPPASDGSRTPLGAFRVFRDERTGYRFSYPSGWEVSASEGITRLVDATGGVIISFRSAPSGSMEDLSEKLMGNLASRFAPLDLVAREEGETPQGEPSLVLGGKATDFDGSPFSFMIVTIEGPDRNRAITVRFSADSDLLDVSSSIRRIAGSFTTSALATAT